MKDSRRLGLVEVEVDDTAKKVVLTLHPPGAPPAVLRMEPPDAIGLACGLAEASHRIVGAARWDGICVGCGQPLPDRPADV